jgi:hypothetical protein
MLFDMNAGPHPQQNPGQGGTIVFQQQYFNQDYKSFCEVRFFVGLNFVLPQLLFFSRLNLAQCASTWLKKNPNSFQLSFEREIISIIHFNSSLLPC